MTLLSYCSKTRISALQLYRGRQSDICFGSYQSPNVPRVVFRELRTEHELDYDGQSRGVLVLVLVLFHNICCRCVLLCHCHLPLFVPPIINLDNPDYDASSVLRRRD